MAKLVECIPNFSVSREKDPAVFEALVDCAKSVPGCFLFDVQSDGNHNRCNQQENIENSQCVPEDAPPLIP